MRRRDFVSICSALGRNIRDISIPGDGNGSTPRRHRALSGIAKTIDDEVAKFRLVVETAREVRDSA